MEKYFQIMVIALTVNNFILAFVWPIIRIRRKCGVFPVNFNKADSIQSLIGKVYVVCLSLTIISAVLFSFLSTIYQYFVPFNFLENNTIRIIGLIINICSIIWIVIGQKQMQETWRIGIYEHEKNKLVTSGLFRFSRHPIFLGLMGLMFSNFLCMPNAITFAVFTVAFILINIEALLEEKELLTKHGLSYEDFCKKTRRWI